MSHLVALYEAIAKIRAYHGTSRKFAPAAMRPSATGLYGPGVYATSNRSHASKYGKRTHSFDIDEKRFVSPRDFDKRNRRIKSGAKTAKVFSRAGYHGVRDGETFAVWDRANLRNHTEEKSPRKSLLQRLRIRKAAGGCAVDALYSAIAKAREVL